MNFAMFFWVEASHSFHSNSYKVMSYQGSTYDISVTKNKYEQIANTFLKN